MSDAEEAYVAQANMSFSRSDAAFQAQIETDIRNGRIRVPRNGAQGLTRHARLLFAPPPDRPRFPGTEAGLYTVTVEFVVTATGSAEHIRVVKSTDHRFDSKAIAAVAHWGYAPALVYGKPVNSKISVPLAFGPVDDFTRPLRFYR